MGRSLVQRIGNLLLNIPASFNQSVAVPLSDLSAACQYDEISVDTLLTQSGYYTIRTKAVGDSVLVGYPNLEVTRSMAQLYADEILGGNNTERARFASVALAMAHDSVEVVLDYFNAVFRAIDYQCYPVKNEADCRAFLQVLLLGAALLPAVEVHNAFGRSDMEVPVGTRHWVFEFKYADRDADAERLIKDGIEQIHSRHYGEQHGAKELIRLALVFSAQSREFVKWERV